MEDLETQKNLLNLGKQLADNFKGVEGDQLSEWISCYIAEKIIAIDSARGEAKLSVQKECFEAILLLWEHQSSFPRGTRPFESFEPVFRALAHIDPDKSLPSYFWSENGKQVQAAPKEIESYINFITTLDVATRVLISFFVREAMLHSTDESTRQWLDAIKCIDKTDEVQVVLKFMPEINVEDVDNIHFQKEKRIKELCKQIECLNQFDSLSRYIRSSLKAQLDDLES